jgi:hypothetical protein
MQADAFDGYNQLYKGQRKPAPILEAACWSRGRRKFFDLAKSGEALIASTSEGQPPGPKNAQAGHEPHGEMARRRSHQEIQEGAFTARTGFPESMGTIQLINAEAVRLDSGEASCGKRSCSPETLRSAPTDSAALIECWRIGLFEPLGLEWTQ